MRNTNPFTKITEHRRVCLDMPFLEVIDTTQPTDDCLHAKFKTNIFLDILHIPEIRDERDIDRFITDGYYSDRMEIASRCKKMFKHFIEECDAVIEDCLKNVGNSDASQA